MVLLCSRLSRLKQVQDLGPPIAIQVAGWLIAQQERWVGDDAPGNADALLLTAGQRAWIMALPDGEGRPRPGAVATCCFRSPGLSPLAAMVIRHSVRPEHRQQIVKLKHESDMPRSPGGELASDNSSTRSHRC